MISLFNKYKLLFITILLDCLIISVLMIDNLNNFDKLFSYFVLIIHILFIFGLRIDNNKLLDVSHLICFALLPLSLYLENKNLLLIVLLLIIIIQVLWIVEEKCILLDNNYSFGYGKTLGIITLINTVLLSIKLGGELKDSSVKSY